MGSGIGAADAGVTQAKHCDSNERRPSFGKDWKRYVIVEVETWRVMIDMMVLDEQPFQTDMKLTQCPFPETLSRWGPKPMAGMINDGSHMFTPKELIASSSLTISSTCFDEAGFNHVNGNGFCRNGGQKTGGHCSILPTKWSMIDNENDDN